ncbi:MAG TPA: prepilin-type N-terminal cleavage/methylation domain-containing protein [Candidatus Angelobacter sp.]|jgi:prepilin-type N-terminal cleavage/methylation domain-containing protein|nr:prepilin-type N-terminal cleavage/methylation domain-containing protein [Candidatus Angelobacter sp.]
MPQSRAHEEGFTLVETLVAMFIMAVGMLGVAALMGQMSDTSVQSRYMSTEALLASEKLEDLNRYGLGDAALTDGGGLGADVPQFSDQIQVSSGKDVSATGDIVEISQGSDAGGNFFWQVRHNPNGTADSTKTYGAPPAATADMVTFDRRWLIEKDQPVQGVRRITVLVASPAMQGLGRQQSFQMSMVKQCSATPCP